MSKEYHMYKVLKEEGRPEQAYVFGITRDKVEKQIILDEIFIFTLINGVEVKHRIDIDTVMADLCQKTDAGIPEHIMKDVMKDMMDRQEEQELKELESNHFARGMLLASEEASKNHLTLTDFENIDEYIKYLAHKKS